jgi:hypothetical protein
MEEILEDIETEEVEVVEIPKFSGKLENIFEDGTVQYDGVVGKPEEVPLTESELNEVMNP